MQGFNLLTIADGIVFLLLNIFYRTHPLQQLTLPGRALGLLVCRPPGKGEVVDVVNLYHMANQALIPFLILGLGLCHVLLLIGRVDEAAAVQVSTLHQFQGLMSVGGVRHTA